MVESFYEDDKVSETQPVVNEITQATPSPAPEPVAPTEKKDKPTTVSFSQYAMWLKCPHRWKLSYVDYLSPYEASINTVFGDAIHEPLQEYLTVLYGQGATEADAIDIYGMFVKVLDAGIAKDLKVIPPEMLSEMTAKFLDEKGVLTFEKEEELNDEIDALGFITPTRIEEFKQDGKNILDHVLSPSIRRKHFPSKIYEVVGVELPLIVPIRGGRINFKGYLDIVLRDKTTKKILIIDFKTSTQGWNKFQRQDRTKMDQLLLYKRFYSMVYGLPMQDIEVEFFIMKRKLLENVAYPQQRIQRLSVPDGKMSIKAVESAFSDFINDCFTPEGKPNKEHKFLKNPDKGKKNCKYCIFKTLVNPKTNVKYCDGKED